MLHARANTLGEGPLTVRAVLEDALGMLRQNFVRICGVALLFFALPAVLTELVDLFLEGQPDHGPVQLALVLVTLFVAVLLRTLGPIAYSGFLDEGVAQEYLTGHHKTVREALSLLPWRRLFVADIIVSLAVSVGLSLFVIPGLVIYGLLGLIGPILVRERSGLRASFRRTATLSRTVPALVIALVVIPFSVEQLLHAVVLEEILHDAASTIQIFVEWLFAVFLGGTLGLIEVALAAELMARNPRPDAQPDGPLLDDGQAPAV